MKQKILAQKKFIFTWFIIVCLCTFPGCTDDEAASPNEPPAGNSSSGCLFSESTDGGETWSTPDTLDKMMDIVYCGALDAGTGVYLLGGVDTAGVGTIWRSTDNGHTFQSCFTLQSTQPKKMYDFNANIFVINFDGSYLKSIDAGSTWISTGTGANAVCMEIMGGATLLLGTNDGRIMRSVDNGLSWINTYSNPAGNIRDIAASIGTTAIACDIPLILRTTDAGLTWDSILYTGTNFLNVHASLYHNGKGIIVSHSDTVFYNTYDEGQTFHMFSYGYRFFNDISISANRTLAASNNGLKFSADLGNSWISLAMNDKTIYQINRNGEAAYMFVVGK